METLLVSVALKWCWESRLVKAVNEEDALARLRNTPHGRAWLAKHTFTGPVRVQGLLWDSSGVSEVLR